MGTKDYWDNNWSEWEQDLHPSLFAKFCLPYLSGAEGGHILDLGCGKGRDSLFFAERGFCVTSLDISETALRAFEHPKIRKVCGDILSFDFSEGFDAVYANLSLHYFSKETVKVIIRKIYDCLPINGYFFMRCKSVHDELYGQGRHVEENMYEYEHIRRFFDIKSTRELLSLFRKVSVTEANEYYFGNCSFIDVVAKK